MGTWTVWPSVPEWGGQHARRIDSNRYLSMIDIDFRYQSKEIEKKKVVTSINIDGFPIEIDNDFLSIPIDCYRFC